MTILLERITWRVGDVEWLDDEERGGPQNWTKGQGGLFTGSKPGGPKLLAPISGGDTLPAESKGGRAAVLTDDPTRFDNLPPEFQDKLLAQLEKQFPGMTREQLQANIEAQYRLALLDPSNNGMIWYGTYAHGIAASIAAENGYTLEQGVGVLAALSPQQAWGPNVSTAQFLTQMVRTDPFVTREGISDEELALVRVQMGERGLTSWTSWDGTLKLSQLSALEQAGYIKSRAKADGLTFVNDVTGEVQKTNWGPLPYLANAINILHGEDPDDVLNGHKVRSFYNNILGGSDSGGSVTIDTHALSAAVGEKVPASDPRNGGILGSPKLTAYSAKGAYSLFADAYRAAAAKYGISPEQMQAMVWIQWRKANP